MSRTILLLRGVQHYEGQKAYEAGRLKPGVSLKLRWEPDNPHDANAVVVLLASSSEKLGYISRKIASRYRDALVAKRITAAKVSKVSRGRRGSRDLSIYVSIGRRADGSEEVVQLPAHLTSVIQELAIGGGVYEITNAQTGRRYIGSSSSVRRRIRQHFTDAVLGRHQNALFQKDFAGQRGKDFAARVLTLTDSSSVRASEEEAWIQRALRAGKPLYNLTSDGQGRRRSRDPREEVPPISDWNSRYRRRHKDTYRNPATGEVRSPQHFGSWEDKARPSSVGDPDGSPSHFPSPIEARAAFAAQLRKLDQEERERRSPSMVRRIFRWLWP